MNPDWGSRGRWFKSSRPDLILKATFYELLFFILHSMSTLIILIPAYNAKPNLSALIHQIICKFPDQKLVVIDDGSTDGSVDKIKKTKEIIVLKNIANTGKGSALKKGISYILENYHNCKAVIFMDADLQHSPNAIPDFIHRFERGDIDFLYGRREFILQKMPLDRILSNYITSWLLSIKLGFRIYDSQCGFRLVSTAILRACQPYQCHKFDFETELLIKASKKGAEFDFINIPTIYNNGKSSIKILRDIMLFIGAYFKF